MARSALVPRSIFKLSFLGVVPACALILGCPRKPQDDGTIVLAMQAFDADTGTYPSSSSDAGVQASSSSDARAHQPQPHPQPTGMIVLAMIAFDAAPPPDAKSSKGK